jgi:hypothetical protein
MFSNVETRTNTTVQSTSKTSPRNSVAAPNADKPRPSFLAGLLKALSAVNV